MIQITKIGRLCPKIILSFFAFTETNILHKFATNLLILSHFISNKTVSQKKKIKLIHAKSVTISQENKVCGKEPCRPDPSDLHI